jgi:hypothetical protein
MDIADADSNTSTRQQSSRVLTQQPIHVPTQPTSSSKPKPAPASQRISKSRPTGGLKITSLGPAKSGRVRYGASSQGPSHPLGHESNPSPHASSSDQVHARSRQQESWPTHLAASQDILSLTGHRTPPINPPANSRSQFPAALALDVRHGPTCHQSKYASQSGERDQSSQLRGGRVGAGGAARERHAAHTAHQGMPFF